MAISNSPMLRLVSTVFATISIGFGINAILRPTHALTFFGFPPATTLADRKLVDSLMAVYGVRDIFMGLAIYAAAYFGDRKTLGWIVIAASSVGFADGFIVAFSEVGKGAWNHWGYAPMLTAVGSLLVGLLG